MVDTNNSDSVGKPPDLVGERRRRVSLLWWWWWWLDKFKCDKMIRVLHQCQFPAFDVNRGKNWVKK